MNLNSNFAKRLGKQDEAVRVAETISLKWPDDPRAWFGQGVYFFDLGDFEKAQRFFTEALVLQPDFTEAWRYKGNACRRLGNIAGAQEAEDIASYCYPPYPTTFAFSDALDIGKAYRAWLAGDYRGIAKWAGKCWSPELYESMPP
jgi:tetratricopeptide (TPR) repeat protein